MKNLFLVDGASSTGKTDILRWVSTHNAGDVGLVRKATTRSPRAYEKTPPLDLDFVAPADFVDSDYTYRYGYAEGWYGIKKTAIDEQLCKNDHVFLVVRHPDTMHHIAADYNFVNVVTIFIHTDRAVLERRLRASRSKAYLAPRLKRATEALLDYYRHPEIYREVLINNLFQEKFHGVVERALLGKYSALPRIDPYLIAVMMSWNPKQAHLLGAMQQAVGEVNPRFVCKRVDQVYGSGEIAPEFRKLIATARCVIVDLTLGKYDLHYELGYINAATKPCLIVAKRGTARGFYAGGRKILLYEDDDELSRVIQAELRGLLRGVPV